MSLAIKRVYEPPSASDGMRVLVDRLWPRGLSKAKAKIDRWEKDLAPSDELRRWFGHETARWAEFRKRYRDELKSQADALRELRAAARRGRVTLLYAAHDEEHNNAVVLAELLKKRSNKRPGARGAKTAARSRTPRKRK
jgi:uncharacterized protein YeaO (DUF488 family)